MEIDTSQEITPEPNRIEFTGDLYKKWFNFGGRAGFLSISPFFTADKGGKVDQVGKVAIDVGQIDPNTDKIKSSTKCFVDAVDLAVYLRVVLDGKGADLYPKRKYCPSPESFVAFGGREELARVLKIHWWNAKDARGDQPADSGDPNGFAWKCGHFTGKVGDNGQIIPNFAEPKGADLIKVSKLEMYEISKRLDLALTSWVTTHANWFEVGRDR